MLMDQIACWTVPVGLMLVPLHRVEY